MFKYLMFASLIMFATPSAFAATAWTDAGSCEITSGQMVNGEPQFTYGPCTVNNKANQTEEVLPNGRLDELYIYYDGYNIAYYCDVQVSYMSIDTPGRLIANNCITRHGDTFPWPTSTVLPNNNHLTLGFTPFVPGYPVTDSNFYGCRIVSAAQNSLRSTVRAFDCRNYEYITPILSKR